MNYFKAAHDNKLVNDLDFKLTKVACLSTENSSLMATAIQICLEIATQYVQPN